MKFSEKKLLVIIPSINGVKALPTIRSGFSQSGFRLVTIVIAGKSTRDEAFLSTLKEEFHDFDVHVATCKNKETVLPGESRNDGTDYAKKTGLTSDYLLFLDDDIVIPEDYSLILAKFLEKNGSCAVMGRVTSKPVNYWTRAIDYSNFWWLQMKESVVDRKWLGAGATLMKSKDIANLRFRVNAAINEDVLFFRLLSKKTKKKLSFCTETGADHNHSRHNFIEFYRYQFNNGKNGVRFRGNGINIISALKKARRNYYMAARANNVCLSKTPALAFGVIMSFLIFQMGIEYGGFLKMHNNFFRKTKSGLK